MRMSTARDLKCQICRVNLSELCYDYFVETDFMIAFKYNKYMYAIHLIIVYVKSEVMLD